MTLLAPDPASPPGSVRPAPALAGAESDPPPPGRARPTLMKRLVDVVCLPSSRVNAFERAMTADLLVEMLYEGTALERRRAAQRLAVIAEAPSRLLRLLLRDEIDVARPLLEPDTPIGDSDLIDCIRRAGPEHRLMIARRRRLSQTVCEVLVGADEPAMIEALLRNTGAELSHEALEALVARSQTYPAMAPGLLRRSELRPAHAYVLFWWAEPEARRLILTRFAVSREVLQDSAGDVFPLAAREQWKDPLARKALQFIERRQRNRAAPAKSPYASLEAAVVAAEDGLTRELVTEISLLAGIKPATGAKIMSDPHGEAMAILCKSTGLHKRGLSSLWKGLRRPLTDARGEPDPGLARAILVYDMMAVDRAQTVLRYWNWSLSSALTPELMQAIRRRDETALQAFSPPQHAAMLVFRPEAVVARA